MNGKMLKFSNFALKPGTNFLFIFAGVCRSQSDYHKLDVPDVCVIWRVVTMLATGQ